MKWRYQSVALVVCGLFAMASSSPAGKKDLLDSGKLDLDKKINPSSDSGADGTEDTDDLLARAKKSSITTFCVEIKPGNDQPAVVVCDPSKSETQVPIPSPHPHPAPDPAPHHKPPQFFNPPQIDDLIPQYLPEFQPPPAAYEPLIYIPQQPQVIPPFYQQIIPSCSQSPVIVLRDPSCPSSHPSIVSSFLQSGISPGHLYSSRSFEYPMDAAGIWKSAYNPEEEALRSVIGTNLGGGYGSPLNTMESSQANFQQSQYQNLRTLPHGSPLTTGNQNSGSIFNGQYVVKCNPTLTPIPMNSYGPVAGKAIEQQDSKTANMQGPLVAGGYQSQSMYPSGGQGHHGMYSTHDTMHHNRGQPMHNGQHYHQSNMQYPYNMHHRMMSGEGGAQQRAAEESQVKGGQDMPMSTQQGQTATDSFAKIISGQQLGGQGQPGVQSSFNNQMNQGAASVSGGDGRVLIDHKQQKMASDKPMGGSQSSEGRFYSSSFSQGKDGFVNGGGNMQSADLKDQGSFQKQMGIGFSQNQQEQKMTPNAPMQTAGSQQKNSEQQEQLVGSDMPSYSRMLMERMKSAVARNNLVQPFMVSSSDLTGNKSTQSKV